MNTDFHPDERVRLKVIVLHSFPLAEGIKTVCRRELITATKAVKELGIVGPKNVRVTFKPRGGDRRLILVRIRIQNPISATNCAALVLGTHEAVSGILVSAKKVECEVGVM